MNREGTASFEEDEEIYEVASEFEDPVVRKYAHILRDAHVTLKSFERPSIAQELVKIGIPAFPAADIADAFRKYLTRGSVGVFWDLENIGLPQNKRPMECLTALRDIIIRKFGQIREFKAYADLATFADRYPPETRVLFRDCGVEMVDAPHNGRKEVADKHIIVDALWFALQTKTENPIVCLISGDSDFSPLLSKLKMNAIPTIVISTSGHVRSLREQSMWALSWPEDFMQGAAPIAEAPQRNRAAYNSASTQQRDYRGNDGNLNGSYRPPSPRRNSPGRVSSPQPLFTNSTNNKPTNIAVSKSSPPSVEGSTPGPQQNFTSAPPPSYGSFTHFDDLVDCIRKVMAASGMTKVRRSPVGILFKKLNPVVPFKKVVSDAEAAGQVVLGGQLGHAWIALTSELSAEDQCKKPLGTDENANSVNGNASSPTTARDDGGWYISVRYNQSFACFGTLQAFRPVLSDHLKVRRLDEPQGNWHRMAIGPFDSMQDADSYFTLNFGDMQLLPKITQSIEKYCNPGLFRPSSASTDTIAAEPSTDVAMELAPTE
ncbi:Hypothetical protein, putative [Bodo saltans]|uniref:NYN domain-containing protein n=1 Tax=Bodo saltans TaxID=75058 RepID=A0A0S4IWY1_BODSA|nr:Hypothetical protein, putative [Bodo saltans]|eukprot:CUG06290.1 Hypothetical protein, putative [Bodo saltans]